MLYKVYNPQSRSIAIIIEEGDIAASVKIEDRVAAKTDNERLSHMIETLVQTFWKVKIARQIQHIDHNESILNYILDLNSNNIKADIKRYTIEHVGILAR